MPFSPISLLFSDPLSFFIFAAAILLALSLHEYAHAWSAYIQGDDTARLQGRLTINPLAHMDPVGTALLFLVGIGWGKPVPFNPLNLRNRRIGELLVGVAGPFSNFLSAFAAGLIIRFSGAELNPNLLNFVFLFAFINIVLGVFNLFPVPPLDGSHILFAIPGLDKYKEFFYRNSLIFLIGFIFILQFVGIGFIIRPILRLFTGFTGF